MQLKELVVFVSVLPKSQQALRRQPGAAVQSWLLHSLWFAHKFNLISFVHCCSFDIVTLEDHLSIQTKVSLKRVHVFH